MGRVQRVPAEAGQWVHGESEVPRFHSAAFEGRCVHHSLHRGPRIWSDREGHHHVYDVTIEEGQADSVL